MENADCCCIGREGSVAPKVEGWELGVAQMLDDEDADVQSMPWEVDGGGEKDELTGDMGAIEG